MCVRPIPVHQWNWKCGSNKLWHILGRLFPKLVGASQVGNIIRKYFLNSSFVFWFSTDMHGQNTREKPAQLQETNPGVLN